MRSVEKRRAKISRGVNVLMCVVHGMDQINIKRNEAVIENRSSQRSGLQAVEDVNAYQSTKTPT